MVGHGALFGKMLATALTLGSGGSGGVFAPSLFLGATLGASYGHLAQDLFPAWTATPGAYALVGMGAVVAATTHAPITAILIVFELTNDYRIIPPLMLACVTAVLLSVQWQRESVYTESLRRRGVRLGEGRDINLLRSLQVAEVMEPNVQVVGASLSLGALLTALMSGTRPEAMVVDQDGRYLGSVDLSDVREVLPESGDLASLVVAADVADHSTPFTLGEDRLDGVMHLFGRTHRDALPVCDDRDNRRVIGLVTKQAVIDAYNRRLFQLDLTEGFDSVMESVRGGGSVQVAGDLTLAEIDVPAAWVGYSLRGADPRRRHGVEVVLVQQQGGRHFPEAELVFAAGDRVLVLGTPQAVRRLGI